MDNAQFEAQVMKAMHMIEALQSKIDTHEVTIHRQETQIKAQAATLEAHETGLKSLVRKVDNLIPTYDVKSTREGGGGSLSLRCSLRQHLVSQVT